MSDTIKLHDYHPPAENILEEVLEGLSGRQKELPPKLFYDARGSALFDDICEQPEYYPTRTEIAIMREQIGAIAEAVGPRAMVVEYGSGSSLKTRILLDGLEDPVAYVPIDISKRHLMQAARDLAADYPDIDILPVCADYDQPLEIPDPGSPVLHRCVYFPGSTIGNLHPEDAVPFLERMASLAGAHGSLLIGVDLRKDPTVLERAYNDSAGVTAAFNLNLLTRLNRELDTDFDLDAFVHRAVYNEEHGRIEMHLVSQADQVVHVGDTRFHFRTGETIWTECSYKYSVEGFAELAAKAGFVQQRVWTDERNLFSVQYLVVD